MKLCQNTSSGIGRRGCCYEDNIISLLIMTLCQNSSGGIDQGEGDQIWEYGRRPNLEIWEGQPNLGIWAGRRQKRLGANPVLRSNKK